ncbi:MAG: hypothetical protein L7T26_11100 [Pseudomonadales bacterium]|nr:hypothetical protein [Pseudomonadales bacterium]
MSKKIYIHLEESETAIFHAASRIYASYLVTVQTTERTNHTALMQQAIEAAIKMAKMTDDMVISDLERQ